MPRNIERDKREADRRKNQLIEAGFRLFSQNGIETVSLQKVADAANVSPATMYKYFLTKEKLLIAISAKVWDEVWQEALGDPGTNHFEHFTAYQGIEFYADRMIALYKNRPEVLRFSGEYKTYMNRRGNMEDKQLREHLDVLKPMQLLFHGMYERAKVDGSIRTDIPEEEMFITSSITMQQLQKEAMPYEQEINDIRLELAQKQRAINIEEDTSGILFGFVPASADDFTEIDKLAAEHSITPVILLDCSQEKEQLAQILEKAVAKDYEVVLAGLQIDESILQTADEMKDLLAQIDDTKSPAFLLRNNVNTEETRNLLNEHGYTELILYDASLQAGMQENGKPYICYGFFKQPVYYADYISQVVTAHTMMLASFSFSTIQNGTLQISDVERFMTLADDRKAANELRYVDLNSAFQAVADQNTTQQERQESYEKYKAEQEKHIQELEEEISAIYSRWDSPQKIQCSGAFLRLHRS